VGRREAHVDISGQDIADEFWKAEGSDISVQSTSNNRDLDHSLIHVGQVTFDGQPATIILGLRPSPTVCIGIGYIMVE
jgi:hypothetical protein